MSYPFQSSYSSHSSWLLLILHIPCSVSGPHISSLIFSVPMHSVFSHPSVSLAMFHWVYRHFIRFYLKCFTRGSKLQTSLLPAAILHFIYSHSTLFFTLSRYLKVKVKFALEQVTKAQRRNSSTLSLTSALDGGGWLTPQKCLFTPGKRRGTHFINGWGGPDECWKPHLHRDSIPGPSSP